ncbi:unnamed protein product [Dicrocoelium dendriticum]|nr:unnamed protein product [Dicrocoelium dendriticum]
MPNVGLTTFYRVSRSGRTAASQKRTALQEDVPVKNAASKAKRPAHKKFSHLCKPELTAATSSAAKDELPSTEDISLDGSGSAKLAVASNEKRINNGGTILDWLCAATEAGKEPLPSPCFVPMKTRLKTAVSSSSVSCASILRRPAHERFDHLASTTRSTAPSSLKSEPPTEEVAVEPQIEATETKFRTDLPLPSSFRILMELFRSCDTVVSMLHNRGEVCGFNRIKPAVQEVVRRNFEESHVGKFLTVYPLVYLLRYDRQLDKYTRRPTDGYTLVLTPNLRTDGTELGYNSPSKGHLVFTGTRLIQRRTRFHLLLLDYVFRAHRNFLQSALGFDPAQLPEDKHLRRWHPRFNLESMVPEIATAPLPVHLPTADQKITTAKDAVEAFQARALFREAEACQKVASLKQYTSSPIPSPTKMSACSPRKPPMSPQTAPSTPAGVTDSGVEPSPIARGLSGVSKTLLAKVRARENERRMLTQLTQSIIPDSQRAIYARLPGMIAQVWMVMRSSNGRALPMSTVAARVADAHHSGLSASVVNEHLEVLLQFTPTWLEKLDWAVPHLRVRDPNLSVPNITDSVKAKLSTIGFVS